MRSPLITLVLATCYGVLSAGSFGATAGAAKPPTATPVPARVSAAEAKAYFDLRRKLDPKSGDQWQQLQDFYPNQDSYTIEELRGFKPINVAGVLPAKGWAAVKHGLTHPMLRENYSDVLFNEDPTVPGAKKKVDDLKGALFTLTHDLEADTDAWAAQAALIFPFVWKKYPRSDFKPDLYGILPSISLHRVTTEVENPTNEVDSLIYRVGFFGRWLWSEESKDASVVAWNLRGFATYGTDTNHEVEIPAGEIELEPQIWLSRDWTLGFVGHLGDKQPKKEDLSDLSYLSYQLRTYIKGEFGSVQQTRPNLLVSEEEFLRVGFVTKLKLSPFFHPRLAIDASYSYMPALQGPSDNDTLLTLAAEWILLEDKDKGDRLSLKASYTKGGLDLTKQEVETLLFGIGATF